MGALSQKTKENAAIGFSLFQPPGHPESQVVMEAVLFPSRLIPPWAGLAMARSFVNVQA